jgi:serine phosphatase RsbU (regulator of sigma subunit)
MTREDKIRYIENTSLFQKLTHHDFLQIAEIAEESHYRKGAYVFRENAQADSFYIIAKGEVEILKNNEDGIEELLALKRAGDVFGEMSVIDDLPRSAAIKAKTDLVLLQLSKNVFNEVLKNFSNIAVEIARNICFTVRQSNQNYTARLENIIEERTRELAQANTRLIEMNMQLSDYNRKVTDSIEYARRIQGSILPNDDLFKRTFSDYFVIYKPLDIVSGDLYRLQRNEDESILVSVMDCTGHGVPGAMMTMTANSILNYIERDLCFNDPGQMLSQMNRNFKKTLHTFDIDEKAVSDDGMDIGICYLLPWDNKLIYAGAKCALYYIRNGKVHEVRGDKKSIGYRKSRDSYRFKNNQVTCNQGDIFIMATDGYMDQNGGPRDYPFGRKKLKEVLSQCVGSSMSEIKKCLEKALADYMGDEQQRDDITVLGFQL